MNRLSVKSEVPARLGVTIVFGALLLALVSSTGLAREEGGPETRVQPGETVGELLERKSASRGSARAEASTFGAFLRLVGAVVGVALLGVAVVWFFRRSPLGASTRRGSDLVEVLGRTAISAKHSVCLLRIAKRRIVVVGVCGDEMTALASIDDPEDVDEILDEFAKHDTLMVDDSTSDLTHKHRGLASSRIGEWLGAWRRHVSSASAGGPR